MDTIIKIINKDKETYIGASNFGYENLLLKSCMKLIEYFNDNSNHDSYSFLESHFKEIDGKNEQDIEAVFDIEKKTVYLQDLLDIKEVTELKNYKKVDFERVDVLLKHELTFEEFTILFYFYYGFCSLNEIIINGKYHLKFHYKFI